MSSNATGRRIGVFGGTFNPIHLGHQALMQNALRELELDELLLIPTFIPPHKLAPELADGRHRLEMCRLAAAGEERITVSDLELRRGGSSYTYLTLRQLRRQYPADRLFLIVGGDMLLSFDQWRRWRDILRMATLCAAPRLEEEPADLIRAAGRYAEIGRGCLVLNTPVVEVSSTQIRAALRQGKSAAGLLCPAVEAYCRSNSLYMED